MRQVTQMNASGYLDLAPYYDALFPVSDDLWLFLSPFVEQCRGQAAPWLDVGCGTGGLLRRLMAEKVDVRGLEPDCEFVRYATNRTPLLFEHLLEGGMDSLSSLPWDVTFAVITCLGNVLPHATSDHAAQDFLAQAARRLRPDGHLIIQMVNYDRLAAEPDWQFPVLHRKLPDGAPFSFYRRYEPIPDSRHILFETRLEIGERSIRNQVTLTPFRKTELDQWARKFFRLHVFQGAFTSNTPWSPSSPATILIASNPS